ncbi:protein TPX2 [Dioscorea cayenensis subsp. rotundata]|uniref:Protein TPX2 n=1 Tax=Dioscorea cayennensis subsp. rotundata TaxID=55577 RepID=A0AB40B6M4_DIOCR|nr:protein TPX2 [Dioscorea cayenensis subsp. rotundata]
MANFRHLGRQSKKDNSKRKSWEDLSLRRQRILNRRIYINLQLRNILKPLNIKLHSEQRAARRAGFNDLVASKIKSLELLRRFEEKIQKVIEEEDIKSLRKEMVPKAQLMPLFDRPFTPQRSNRPLTVPKEPSFLRMNKKCSINEDPYTRCTNILLRL